MASDGSVNYDVTADTKGFTGPLGSANQMIGGLGRGIGGLIGPIALMVGVAGGLGSIGKALGGAADLEQMAISFEVLTGSMEKGKSLLEDVRKMGAATPYEFPALAEGVKTLLNFGIAADDTLPLIGMLGDVAGGSQDKLSSLSLVLGQVSSNARLTGGDLLQFINAGWNPLNEIVKKTGESMADARKRMEEGRITYEEVKAALVAATSAGGQFHGMMEKQSGSNLGLLSTLKDTVNEIFVTLGKPLNDALKPVLQGAITDAGQLGASLAAAIQMAQGAMANGKLGEILGLSLKIAAKEGINALIQGHIKQIQMLGSGLMMVVGEVSKGFSIGLLSTSQLFAGDMHESIVQMANNVKSAFSWALSEAVAVFEAGILYAVQQLKEQIGKIPMVGKGLKGFKADSFDSLLNKRRDANGRPDLNINTRPISDAASFIEGKLMGAGAAIEKYWTDVLSKGNLSDSSGDRAKLADLMKSADPEAFKAFLAATKDMAAPIKDSAAAAGAAIAKDVPKAITAGATESADEQDAPGRRKIRLAGLAESEDRRKARMSKADQEKLGAGGSLLGAVTPSRKGLLPRVIDSGAMPLAKAAAAAAGGAPAMTPPTPRGGAAKAEKKPETSLLDVLKEIAGNTAALKQLATA